MKGSKLGRIISSAVLIES